MSAAGRIGDRPTGAEAMTTGADEEERLARVTLNAIGEPGSLTMTRLVTRLGPRAVLAGLRHPTDDHGRDVAQRLATADPARLLEQGARAGLRFVVPGDDEWPASLDDLARSPSLHERGGVPVGLWLKGPLRLDEAVDRAVAIVGSRSATSYGSGVAGDLAAGLAGAGWTDVSGAAVGIDYAGHRAALAMRGTTVAVLACGADKVYPQEHRHLFDRLAEVGLVVSEAPLGGAPTRVRFLARNRLIGALTQGTIVVEAASRSGSLNTASWAESLGRVVMGTPGPVTSESSAGVHQLLRRGAVLVTRAEEALEALAPIGQHTLFEPREPARPRDRLTGTERQVLDAVPVVNGASGASIARAAGLRQQLVESVLSGLFRRGLVEHAGDRWRLDRDHTTHGQGGAASSG